MKLQSGRQAARHSPDERKKSDEKAGGNQLLFFDRPVYRDDFSSAGSFSGRNAPAGGANAKQLCNDAWQNTRYDL